MTDSGIGNAFFQDVLPVASSDGVRAGPDPVPAAAGARAAAVRRGLGPHDRRPDDLHDPRRDRRGHLLVDARPAADPARRPPADGHLLRLRDGLLVRRPARHHLVPGAHRRGRPGACSRSGSRSGRIRRAQDDEPFVDEDGRPARAGASRHAWRARLAIDRRQFAVGLLFGLACTARLTVLFAAPFFLLVGAGGSWWRRGWSAGLGAAIPVGGSARLQHRDHGQRLPSGLRPPLPARGAGLHEPRLQPRLVGRGSPLPRRRTWGSCSCPRPTSCPTAPRHASARSTSRCAPTRAPTGACSTRTARSPCPATSA